MKTVTDEDKIEDLLSRGIEKIYPSKEELRKVLASGKRLKIYQGFDPTGDRLHLGHMVGFRKHKQWQDLGHEVIFLIGDGTGQAGDPSGKKKTRERFFTQNELRENAKNYLEQASKIVDFDGPNPVTIKYNGEWLNKLTLVDILDIAQNFSLQQLIERDMFQERLKAGETINMREFLYPLLQGYDSVAMEVDLELGGSDQTFNMLAGRTLLKNMKGKEKFVMTTPLLADSKGVKIGKSEGNVIGLTDKNTDLFGKIMSLGDDSIIPLFSLLTDTPLDEIRELDVEKEPMELKKKVASIIVTQLHDEQKAAEAREAFENTFQKKEIPEDLTIVEINEGEKFGDALVRAGVVASKSELKRLFTEGAISVLGEGGKIEDPEFMPQKGDKLKIGKRRFIQIK